MASNFKSTHLLFFLILLVVSCEKESQYKPSFIPPPKLFIIGQIDPTFGVSVKVSKAISVGNIANFDTIYATSATVKLMKSNGSVFNLENRGKGLFYLDTIVHKVQIGDACSISVSGVSGYPDAVSDFVVVPPDVKHIKNIDIWKTGGHNGNIPFGEGIIEFSDNLLDKNTYIIRLYGQTGNNRAASLDCSISLVQLCETYHNLGLSDATFSDECVVGKDDITVNINGQLNGVDGNGFWAPADRAIIYFGTVSENYHEFIYSLLQPEDIEKGLAEPKPSYSNINGGLGIIYTTNLSLKIVELQ